MNSLMPLPVVVPLAAAILLAAGNKLLPRWFADGLAIMATVATGIISGILLNASTASPIVYWFGGWTPRAGVAVGIDFYVDPISAGLAAFTCLLTLAAFIFSLRYFDSVGTLYHVLMLGFMAAMCGFSFSGDLFNLFVFFELMSVVAFALCGYKNEESSAQQGALNFAVLNTVGAFLALFGIGLLYARTGALNMAQVGRALSGQTDVLVLTAFAFLLCGFYVKAAAFPFHFWLADAHAVAPTPVCILFSGIMVELGVYAVARVFWAIFGGPFVPHRPALTGLLLVIGTLTALVGALMCFQQRHIKRLLAFSTISHVGLLVIGFALLRPNAFAGTVVYLIAHGLFKGALFIGAGILLHRFSSVDELALRGRGAQMPWTGLVFVVGGLGLASAPLFGTFLGEHGIEAVAERSGYSWIESVFILAAAFTAGAVFRVYGRVFLGRGPRDSKAEEQAKEEQETDGPHQKTPASMYMPAVLLLLLGISVGLIPNLFNATQRAAADFASTAQYQARVLNTEPAPRAPLEPVEMPLAMALLRSSIAVALAVLLAAGALSAKWRPKVFRWTKLRHVVAALQRLHSGHIGDYVAYFTFGVAAIGVALALLI